MKWRVMVGAADGTVTTARGQHRRVHGGRLFGGNVGAVDCGRNDDPGRAALPEPTPLPALRRAAAAERLPYPIRQHHAGQADEHADDAGVVSHQGLKRRTGLLVLDQSRTRVF